MANFAFNAPCPTCGRVMAYSPANPWRPFCSETCRSHDLGAWAGERFRIASSGDLPGEGDRHNPATPLDSDTDDRTPGP